MSDEFEKRCKLESLICEREAILVEVEAMKFLNLERLSNGMSIGYGESNFYESSRTLNNIAEQILNLIKKEI